jgi:hypothetical protein
MFKVINEKEKALFYLLIKIHAVNLLNRVKELKTLQQGK